MQRCDTVDGVAADCREVRHADVAMSVLADDRHPAQQVAVTGESGRHLDEEFLIDLVDDLGVPGQRFGEHLQRPRLQRLGQQGVVGVADGGNRDFPGRLPLQAALVDKQTHQLGDSDRRMGVVELHGESLWQLSDRGLGQVVHDVQDVLQRT